MVRAIRCLVAASALSVFGPSLASAQGSNWFTELITRAGVGASVGWVAPTDGDVKAGTVLGVQFGVAPKRGWALTAGFGWYGADLFLETRTGDRQIGSLDFRPIMGGLGYTWVIGRVATSVALNAGVSFNSTKLSDEFLTQFPGSTLDMKHSFVVQYALHPKFALNAWAGYAYTEIDSTLTTSEGRVEDEWDASNFSVSFGFMVYPFR